MILRKLERNDYFYSIFEILGQLSTVGENITYEEFENWFVELPKNHNIFILEIDNKIVGMGTLLIESKLIHRFGKVGHIEDIVISNQYRGKGYGKYLVKKIVEIAKTEFHVYKVILNCSESNILFYENCGFQKNQNQMVQYFKK